MWLLIALMASWGGFSKPVATAARPDPRIAAHAQIRKLVAGIQLIERIRAKAPSDARDASCVDEKLAEARAGLQIAGGELERLGDGSAPAGDVAYALHRLQLLVERENDLDRAARVCATEELSSIDTTQVEVEVSPAVPAFDPTLPRSSFQAIQRPPAN
ncbi:MAG TPA: hypothetical protein VHO06_24825 [Polyangia bacterium]|nr:hypothetical protein [Polyangia bacterium]